LVQIRRRIWPFDPVFYRQCAAKIIRSVRCSFPARANFERTEWVTATFVLMAAVAAALSVSFAVTRKLPAVPLATALLVTIFGGLTLYLQDPVFIKMKPTVLYAAFGLVLAGGLSVNKSLLPAIFDGALALTKRGWRLLTFRWAGFFFVLAALNEVVWRTQSNDTWIAFKFPGIFILILVYSLAQVPLIKRHGLPQEEAERVRDDY
jgi:intracellular septation protein